MYPSIVLFIMFLAFIFLLSRQASMAVYAISYGLFAVFMFSTMPLSWPLQAALFLGLLLLCIGLIRPLRLKLLSRPLFLKMSAFVPAMSQTEKDALEAGTVGFEGEIFSGSPDIELLLKSKPRCLTQEEQAFINGPLKELCRMLDDWDITHNRTDLPKEVWDFIKAQGFLGMIIPKHYGGLEFSATAQSLVLATLYGRSISAATTVSVPNSLGPAELLLHYGTEAQKDYYLPRLANGQELPCFALTSPKAGSDAASISDKGIIVKRMVDGKEVLGILLNWNKRYITLCPVATVIGLAFKLYDPENYLGRGNYLGISCALVPANTEGISKGRRHFPLNTAFLNGPTQGKDVFVSLDCLIGGAAKAGQGWSMLMECLSAGRAISLPSAAMGGTQAAALASGAYARLRKQFHKAIAHFEGIEEPLARIAGNAYLIDAALSMTAAAIDEGARPSVAGAILKYHTTERARKVALDAMDIHGGKGICLGPKNYLGRAYQNAPISITVEGANILTRSLIIFGQGAIRCHPYLYQELQSFAEQDLKAFDRAFWGHVGFFLANALNAWGCSFSNACFTKTPGGPLKAYYRSLHRYSRQFAFLADFCLISLGAALKRQEKISARLGDMFSSLYLLAAVLKRFHKEGELESDVPLATWCCQQLLYEYEEAMRGLILNFPKKWSRRGLKLVLLPFGQQRMPASDALGKQLAGILSSPNELRSRLTRTVFTEAMPNCPLGKLEAAFLKNSAVEELEEKLHKALKAKKLSFDCLDEQLENALKMGLISQKEAEKLQAAKEACQEVIAVDDFDNEELRRHEANTGSCPLKENAT